MNKFLLNTIVAAAILFAQPFAISGGTLQSGMSLPPIAKVESVQANKQAECLAKNVYREARGQSKEGQIAVANVTLNRAKAKGTKDVCKVVYERSGRGCQFSWTCAGNKGINEPEKYAEIKALAVKAVQGRLVDNTKGATYFHAKMKRKPSWTKDMVVMTKIDDHTFYRRKNEWLTHQM